MIPEDVTAGLGGYSGDEKKRHILTDGEIEKLRNAGYWENKKAYCAFMLSSTSALRMGECLALRREDIGEKVIYIRHNWNIHDGLKKPKNGEERRGVLLPEIRALLFELLAENPTDKSGGQFIFFSDMAPEKPCSDYVLTLYFKKAIESAKIDISGRNIAFHSLRHYALTTWANKTGEIRKAQKIGGHKSLQQTEAYADHIHEKELDIKNDFNNLLKATTDEEKIGILYAIKAGKFKIMFEEIANDFIKNADNALINAHYVYDFCIYETTGFFIDLIEQHCIDESRMDYFKQVKERWLERLDNIDYEFRECISKLPNSNIPIKEFPQNTTDKEKGLLNHLAKNYHIRRELSENGKFPLFIKTGTKRLISALYEYAPDYKDFHVFNFIHSFIEINLPDATLQNYCRIVKKDMPL